MPSIDDFNARFFSKAEPVVITGAMDGWTAMRSWSLDYLKSKIGDVDVDVYFSEIGLFEAHPTDGWKGRFRVLKAGDYIDMLATQGDRSPKYYLLQVSIPKKLTAILPDIQAPPYFADKGMLETNLWLAPAGYQTRLHYDFAPNLLAQVNGRKRAILFSPKDLRSLYPQPMYMNVGIAHHSAVDIDRPDFEKYPRLRHAEPWEASLSPGDMLFIPTAWWHQVYTEETGASVNHWCPRPWRDNFLPSIIRIETTRLLENVPARIRNKVASLLTRGPEAGS
jgi:hypothetical protein